MGAGGDSHGAFSDLSGPRRLRFLSARPRKKRYSHFSRRGGQRWSIADAFMRTNPHKNIPARVRHALVLSAVVLFILTPMLTAKKKDKTKAVPSDGLADYLQRVNARPLPAAPTTVGSLWTDTGRLANMVTDYKAARVGDLVTISVAQNLSATSSGNVSTNRTLSANSGITALPGQLKTSGIANLFSPNSAQSLSGKAQATSQTSLSTTLTGRVAAVLPSGTLVVEAERLIAMNNQRETVILRGLVRPGDLDAANTVASNNVGNLEVEVKGKGVISEGIRP